MTTQKEKVEVFVKLHVKGSPLILFNIWDAGSAIAVAESGVKAIATSSWSVAAANGYADGEKLSLDLAINNLKRIVKSVDLPVTIDFEGGYATGKSELCENIKRVINVGPVGINFEDQIVGGTGLYSVEEQTKRIETVRQTAEKEGIFLFINARTDVFLKNYSDYGESHLDEAIERAKAYANAGASGFFAPGLRDTESIKQLAEASPIPLNIMVLPNVPSNDQLAELGVSRISYGAAPYNRLIEFLKESARKAFDEAG